MTNTPDDRIDLNVIQLWDNRAMEVLYDYFYKALVAFSTQMIGEQQAAEDIVQEVFFSVWKQKNQFRSVGSMKAYLFNAVRNESLNNLRHRKVRQETITEVQEQYKAMLLSIDEDEELHKAEVYRQMFLAIDQLPSRQREIFLMAVKGKKNSEIAQALNVSINTVKTLKRNGLKTLRGQLSTDSMLLLLFLLG